MEQNLNIPESSILTVSKLNGYIKQKLNSDSQLMNIWVRGEISNYIRHSNGHLYFTLKDETSQIKCIMFDNYVFLLKFEPENGMKVLLLSSVDVYEPYGSYQLVVQEIHAEGIGDLHLRFLQLSEKLKKEGLFSKEYKKPLPEYPRTIGIITSPTGAVIKDLVRNLRRRFPPIEIKLIPTLVQGIDAARDIVSSIELFNKIKAVDVIILGRGGGSLEDLWCFNEEIVARAIFNSEIPIISAVGHERDVTIADFVADVRASTPSTAAEIAVKDKNSLLFNINNLKERAFKSIKRTIEVGEQEIAPFVDRPIFSRPFDFINQYLQQVDELASKSNKNIQNYIRLKEKELEIMSTRINSLNPETILGRGYSMTMSNGRIIKNSKDIKIEDIINVILKEGEIKSKVIGVKNGRENI